MRSSLAALLLSLVICLGAGWIGSVLTRPAIPVWYAGLEKPAWTPASWIISTVWRTVFALMGVALWMAWREAARAPAAARRALIAFFIQLALNIAWSAVFFARRNPGGALVTVAALWIAIAVTIVFFWRLRPAAGALLLPYIAWVSFAAALNAAVWRLNDR